MLNCLYNYAGIFVQETSLPEVRPFQGIYYNQSLVIDSAAVICPPYDIISPQLQQELNRRSEYNFVRLEYSPETPGDSDRDNRYTRAAATLDSWLDKQVLRKDYTPALYLHDYHFTHRGRKYRRRSLIGTVRLEDWSKKAVRPHEGTLTAPKTDRLNLLWALQANTSPILTLFSDLDRQLKNLLAEKSRRQPILKTDNGQGEAHRLWAINDDTSIALIREVLTRQPLYIADGHHRYESALNYRRERHACSPSTQGDELYDFVMMEMVNFADPGLVILPAHRMVSGMSKSTIDHMVTGLKAYFQIDDIEPGGADVAGQVEALLAGESPEIRLVLYGLAEGRLSVLKLKDFQRVSGMMPPAHSAIYKKLDVSIVDHVILEDLLGLDLDAAGDLVAYSHDIAEVIKRVKEKEYQLAFIVSPVRPETVKAIADKGDRMPRKSTYFYPKAPSGLVFYRFI